MRDEWTTVDDVLAGLPRSTSDAARSERVRGRCMKTLSGSRHLRQGYGGQGRPAVPGSTMTRAIESAVVGGFCAVYLCFVAVMALHTHGVL